MIKIYDNAFSANYATKVLYMVKQSVYGIEGWNDSIASEYAHNVCLHSFYSNTDVATLGILEELKKHDVAELVNFNNFDKCIINLSFTGQTHIEHTHNSTDVILYYVNPVWNRTWAGETLFYSEDGAELERAVEYIPNRLVFFTGEHPHKISPPSFEASFFRFTLSLFFIRE